MKNVKNLISVFLSVIINIAILAFLFSLHTSKPIADSDAPVSLVSLVSQKSEPQKQNSQPQQTEKKTQPKKQEIPQNVVENGRMLYAPTNANQNENNKNFDVGAYSIRPSVDEDNGISENNEIFTENIPQINSPKALYVPNIPYPKSAKSAKIEGTAEISYIIDENGRVISVEILSVPHISFENVIKRAVLSWRFAPATQNGKPISIKANKTIVFKLTD